MTSPSDPPGGDSFASLLAESETGGQRSASFRVGDRLDVVVNKIGKVAVFVTFLDGKQEGFIDVADLTGKDGKLTVEVGARVTCKVAEMGGKTGAVRLSPLVIRASHDDDAPGTAAPAAAEQNVLVEGMKVKGVVSRVERYGVFVQIAGSPGRKGRGLVPASESGTPRNADLNKSFPVGAEIEAKIVRVEEDGKIRLSIIALKADEERSLFETFNKTQGEGEEKAKAAGDKPGGNPRSFGTLGDLLKKSIKK